MRKRSRRGKQSKGNSSRGIKIALLVLSLLFVFVVILPLLFGSAPSGNIAHIALEGTIMGSGGGGVFGDSGIISSQSVVAYIEEADADPSIDALYIEINSPGGSAVASDEIAAALEQVSKPSVAVIREAGASGGYWIASSADHIVANRMSITGSIGVISSYLEFSDLFEEYGITYQRLVAGEKKDVGSPFRSLSDDEEALFQKKLDIIHDYFITAVAENRGLDASYVREVASGEFYLGVEAFELGLVDALGGEVEALDYLYDVHGIESDGFRFYQESFGLMSLFGVIGEDLSFHVGEGIGSALVEGQSRPKSLTVFT